MSLNTHTLIHVSLTEEIVDNKFKGYSTGTIKETMLNRDIHKTRAK